MFIIPLSLAANCCLECASDPDGGNSFRLECFHYLEGAAEAAFDSAQIGDIDFEERDEITKFILELLGVCRNCEKEKLIFAAINSQWVAPTLESLKSIGDMVREKKEAANKKARKKGRVTIVGNLYRVKFPKKKKKP
jgi:hypothetical protein